ncbi:hypothetical protein HDU93_000713 [Gonapodya sp. JEL0774]|nr:hypothetical protein HDU93_000713 [Gonapodya sp. JEL0774]
MITTTTNLLTLIVTGIILVGSAVVMLQVGAHKHSPSLANLSLIPRAPPPPPLRVLKPDLMPMIVVSELTKVLAKNPHLHLRCSIGVGVGINTVKTILNTNSLVVTQELLWPYCVMGNGKLAKALARLRKVEVKGLPGCKKVRGDEKLLGSKSAQAGAAHADAH